MGRDGDKMKRVVERGGDARARGQEREGDVRAKYYLVSTIILVVCCLTISFNILAPEV